MTENDEPCMCGTPFTCMADDHDHAVAHMSGRDCSTRGGERVSDHCGWDVEYAQLCTATPGVLHPSGNLIALCPPEQGCTDAVMHRAQGTGWHTNAGTTVAQWYAQRRPTFQQLTLEAS